MGIDGLERLDLMDFYHVPVICEKCGGVMVFKGVGEYHCEDCDCIAYDDYGKVRLYLEDHSGANMVQIEQATGVPQKAIRKMLKDSRLQVAPGSKTFLHCEVCGAEIYSGQFCAACEVKVHRNLEEQQRKANKFQGVGMGNAEGSAEGQRRFMRNSDN